MGRKKQKKADLNLQSKEYRQGLKNSPGHVGSNLDSNAEILPSRKQKKQKSNPKTPGKKLSKTQEKKLRKILEKKEKSQRRAALYASLKKTEMPSHQFGLLKKTASMGQKETLKQKVTRHFHEQKAGLQIEEDSPLFQNSANVQSDEMLSDSMEDSTQLPSFPQLPQASDDNPFKLSFAVKHKPNRAKRKRTTWKVQQDDTETKPKIKYNNESSEESESDEESESENEKNNSGEGDLKKSPHELTKDLPSNSGANDTKRKKPESATNSGPNPKKRAISAHPSSPKISNNFTPVEEKDEVVTPLKLEKFVVTLNRNIALQIDRMKLPICSEEQEIMEAINEHDVCIVCGETGSGKTTQVPQFLYECGYSFSEAGRPGLIGVTEPRRVAAVSMAKRVGEELNRPDVVSHQIRYDSQVTRSTAVKFMTDGILLKEIQADFLLKKYSVIILDEAHERNINTDVLVGLLSRIVPLRRELYEEQEKQTKQDNDKVLPLKLIIMSATLRVGDFTENSRLFPRPPSVLKVNSRQHKVTIHFSKRTPLGDFDYTEAVFDKICKIHKRLPHGGVLVFMTGKREIDDMCKRVEKKFAKYSTKSPNLVKQKAVLNAEENLNEVHGDRNDDGAAEELSSESNINTGAVEESTFNLEDDSDVEDETNPDTQNAKLAPACEIVRVLPLYSLLPTKLQMRVFEPVDENTRLIVIATNVAETSLTIPGIKYVLDSGKEKKKVFDKVTGMSTFVVDYISKASADQRAGRAGRVGPGHCYRLYSSAVFDRFFDQFSEPEILRVPIQDTVLQMKSMDIHQVKAFPFPTAPDSESVSSALRTLETLGACSRDTQRITPLGRTLSVFPISVRFAKMLLLANQGGCLPFVIAIVASLTVEQMQETGITEAKIDEHDSNVAAQERVERVENDQRKSRQLKQARQQFAHRESDLLSSLRIVGAFEFAEDPNKFCHVNFLRQKKMFEIEDLRKQLSKIVLKIQGNAEHDEQKRKELNEILSQPLFPPSTEQGRLLLQIIASGLIDHVARKWPAEQKVDDDREKNYQMLRGAYQCSEAKFPVYIHPSSYLFPAVHQPSYLVYHQLVQTKKSYMKMVTAIKPEWLLKLAPHLCTVSKPLENPPPRYVEKEDMICCYANVLFGPQNWSLPVQRIAFPDEGDIYYRQFGYAFLEGHVFKDMSQFSDDYTPKPSILTLKLDKCKSRPASNLVKQLKSQKIKSKAALLKMWETNPRFLLTDVMMWLSVWKHPQLQTMWPPEK